MLRRVARPLRILLLLSGTLFLASTPLSLFVHVTLVCPWPTAEASYENWQVVVIHVGDELRPATLRISVLKAEVTHQRRFEWNIIVERAAFKGLSMWLKPSWDRSFPFAVLTIPLWLLAVLCLAWPVTSFIVSRRRRKARGFEVEPKPDSAVSTADS